MPGPGHPATFTYESSVTSQQRAWVQDAIERCMFAVDRLDVAITVKTVDEPSCPGHNDYMCSTVTGKNAVVEIRTGADDPNAKFNANLGGKLAEVKKFFQEAVVHELGHIFFFAYYSDEDSIASLASMFQRGVIGESATTATIDDWNPLDAKWADRAQEALAEFFKDVYLASQFRYSDNRTNWNFDQDRFNEWFDLIDIIICPDN